MAAAVSSILVDAYGKPLPIPGKREEKPAAVRARYDAAQNSNEFSNYWAASDSLDADSSNSKPVRKTLVARSRYEVGNNGFTDGIVQTFATDLIGKGPKLQLQTSDKNFNKTVEKQYTKWAKAVKFRRKLWTMAHAKVQDGEAFCVYRNNPRVKHPVKLDPVLFETEQCTTPTLAFAQKDYIDGISFDEFGNPLWYDILKQHPGGPWYSGTSMEFESIPAKFVCHWFLLRRPGQHRAVPEFRSTLNLGAAARRWRESTLAAAETAANFTVLLSTTLSPDEVDAVSPMSTLEIQKRMMTALPENYAANQMKAEHPNATHESFNSQILNEQARPKSMPANKAACDSSKYNFASGRLDHLTYHGSLDDVEREDCNDLVLDPTFELWWEEASIVFGWVNPDDPMENSCPDHCWDWPKHPTVDVASESQANDVKLKNGSLSLSSLYDAQGESYDDEVVKMASDYGVSVLEMKKILLFANLNAQNQQASVMQAQTGSAGGQPLPNGTGPARPQQRPQRPQPQGAIN